MSIIVKGMQMPKNCSDAELKPYRSRFEVTDKDAHWAEMVLNVIRDIDCPMLMYQAEKDVVEKALRMLFDDWELGKIKEQTYMPVEEQPCI